MKKFYNIILLILILIFINYFTWSQEDEELDISDFLEIDKLEKQDLKKEEKIKNNLQNKKKNIKIEKNIKKEEKISKKEKKISKKEKKEEKIFKKEKEKEKISKKDEKNKKKDENKDFYEENTEKEENFDENQENFSGVKTDENRTTLSITISGSLGLNFIARSSLFDTAIEGNKSNDFEEEFFDPLGRLRLDIELQNNIKGVFEIQNEDRYSIFYHTSLGNIYITEKSPENRFRLEIERAYFEIDNFLTDRLIFKAGIIPLSYPLQPDKGAFFLDLGNAESPFSTREDTHALGFLFSYQPFQLIELYIDTFYFVTSESSFKKQDETILGLNFDLELSRTIVLSDDSTITLLRFFNLIFTMIRGDNNSPIWSIGGGFNYYLSNNPENYLVQLYGEAIFQFGEYNRKDLEPELNNKNQDQLAFGGYLGIKFIYEKSNLSPFIDISYWYISGDDNNPNRDTNNDLITYENIDSTLIIEDNDYGFDIDSNYMALKIETGLNLNPLFKDEEVKLSLLYSHFSAIDVSPGKSKRMGDEIDIKLQWNYSQDLIFKACFGMLLNSLYFKEFFDEVNENKGKKEAFLFKIETRLDF